MGERSIGRRLESVRRGLRKSVNERVCVYVYERERERDRVFFEEANRERKNDRN